MADRQASFSYAPNLTLAIILVSLGISFIPDSVFSPTKQSQEFSFDSHSQALSYPLACWVSGLPGPRQLCVTDIKILNLNKSICSHPISSSWPIHCRIPAQACLCLDHEWEKHRASQEIWHTVAAEPRRAQSDLVFMLLMHTFPQILVSVPGKPPPTSLCVHSSVPSQVEVKETLAIYRRFNGWCWRLLLSSTTAFPPNYKTKHKRKRTTQFLTLSP